MENKKNIDDLVLQKAVKQGELASIHRSIQESKQETAIVIVDFTGSTALKQNEQDADWLAHIFGFIQHIDKLVKQVGGVLVKRMGDGLLLSFQDVQTAEAFFEALENDPMTGEYPHKASADFGSVYYFKFEPQLNDDPYGTAVDRCSRILGFAQQGVTLCSPSFVNKSMRRDGYRDAGQFTMKGFAEPQKMFFRVGKANIYSLAYLKPLLDKLNSEENQQGGFRFVPRNFLLRDFTEIQGESRPFLLRELLNVPRLPLTHLQFSEWVSNLEEKEELKTCIGLMIEWECNYSSHARIGNDTILIFLRDPSHREIEINVRTPTFMIDALRFLKKGQLVRLRGLIMDANTSWIDLDYADFERVTDDNSEKPKVK